MRSYSKSLKSNFNKPSRVLRRALILRVLHGETLISIFKIMLVMTEAYANVFVSFLLC